MTLFVVLGLVAVVVGVLVAVALGVRSMRAEEHGAGGWDSPVQGGDVADPDGLGGTMRRDGERRRPERARPSVAAGEWDSYGGRGGPARGMDREQGAGRGGGPVPAADTGRPRRASRRAAPHDTPGPAGPARAGKKRRGQPREQPRKRTRQPQVRGAGTSADWGGTNWDRVSDEDYWAELSADKPLAARTAQSAADLGPSEAEPRRQRDTGTEPNLARAEPQPATMTVPGFGAPARAGNEPAQREVAALPVRRSGSAPDTGRIVPAASTQAGPGGADYTDPNLAMLASMSEPTGGPPARHPAAAAPSAPSPDQQNAPSGAWPGGQAGPGDWQRSPGYAATGTGPNTYYSAPSHTAPSHIAASGHPAPAGPYRTPARGLDRQTAASYLSDTPGHGIPAGSGHSPDSPYGTSPDTGSYTGRHDGSTPRVAGSYGYPRSGPSYGSGQHPAAWGTPGGGAGRSAETNWQAGQPGTGPLPVPGPGSDHASANYSANYTDPYAGGYPGTPYHPGGAAGTPPPSAPAAGGFGGQPAAGGFASGYLSSSALSARRPAPEPEPLDSTGSGNPYGSYVTGTPPGDGVPAPRREGHGGPPDYAENSPYRRYGAHGGPHH